MLRYRNIRADETGLRVDGKLHWPHVLATAGLTWIGIHPNRGKWAQRLIEMLLAALRYRREVERAGGPLASDRIACLRSLYEEIIAEGEAANPRAPPSGKS